MELDAKLNVRISGELMEKIDTDAAAVGVNRSEWVIDACERKLAGPPVGRRMVVQRGFARGQVPPRLCSHPPQLRSDTGPDGTTRCMACNEIVRPAV